MRKWLALLPSITAQKNAACNYCNLKRQQLGGNREHRLSLGKRVATSFTVAGTVYQTQIPADSMRTQSLALNIGMMCM
jgi:hypothetical protein